MALLLLSSLYCTPKSKLMKNSILILALFTLGCTTKVDPSGFQNLDWLIGTWEGKAGDATFYEHWSKASETELKNINFELMDGDTANSHHASIMVRDGEIIYKGTSVLKATSLDAEQIIFENKEEARKYIFRLDDQGRWIAILDNKGAHVEYQLTRTTPLEELVKQRLDTIRVDTLGSDTVRTDTLTQ